MALYQSDSSRQAESDAMAAPGVFWGHSAGSPEDLRHAEECVRKARLNPDELHDLRAQLPIGATGTTGQRVIRIDRVLKRLEKEASQ